MKQKAAASTATASSVGDAPSARVGHARRLLGLLLVSISSQGFFVSCIMFVGQGVGTATRFALVSARMLRRGRAEASTGIPPGWAPSCAA